MPVHWGKGKRGGDRVRHGWVQAMWSLGVLRDSNDRLGLASLDTGVRGVAGWLRVGVGLAVGSQVVVSPGLEGVAAGPLPVLWEVGVHRVYGSCIQK